MDGEVMESMSGSGSSSRFCSSSYRVWLASRGFLSRTFAMRGVAPSTID